MEGDSRYPYTYACDYIRGLGPIHFGEGVVLSRGDCSQIIEGVARALQMTPEELNRKLADAFLKQQEDPEHRERESKRLMAALGIYG